MLYLPPLDLIQWFFFRYTYMPDCLFNSGDRHDQHIDVLRHKSHERVIFGLKFRKRVLPDRWECRRHVDGGLYIMWWVLPNGHFVNSLLTIFTILLSTVSSRNPALRPPLEPLVQPLTPLLVCLLREQTAGIAPNPTTEGQQQLLCCAWIFSWHHLWLLWWIFGIKWR